MRSGAQWRLLWVGILAAILVLASHTTATAGCLGQVLPETSVSPQDAGWCVAGAIGGRDQPVVRFTVPSTGLWQVKLEVLPAQLGMALLSDDGAGGGRQVWQGATSRTDPVAASPLQLLLPGAYSVSMSTGDAAMVYRLRLLQGPPLPRTLSGPVTSEFTGTIQSTQERTVIPWTLSSVSPGTLWTASAQAPPGPSMSFELVDPNGVTIISTSASDVAGVFRLPDLDLLPGAYQLVINGAPPDRPIIVSAIREARSDGFATEPDERPEQAHLLQLARSVSGRLVTNGSYGEHDTFVLVVPPQPTNRRYDVSLSTHGTAQLSLALLDETGNTIVQRDGASHVELRALRLTTGRHVLQVSGALPVDIPYSLLVDEAGPASADSEVEPNDIPASATAITASGSLSGNIDGEDKDYLDLNVPSGLELWDIEVIGEGVTTLGLYDGANQVIATASATPSMPLVGFSHLLLPYGHNVLRLEGTAGPWLLRAHAIGPPVDGEEMEPDDDPTRALALVAGRPQVGWIERQDDRDFYTFHLAAPHRVHLSIAAPSELALQLRLSWGDTSDRVAAPTTTVAPDESQQLDWDGLLPPGDYFIELMSTGGISRDAYTLQLDAASFFDRPLDLEPNDSPSQAVAVPNGQQLSGVLQGDSDADWYFFDPKLQPGPLSIVPRVIGRSLSLRLAKGDPAAPETVQQLDLYRRDEAAVLDLPAGERLLLQVSGSAGPYTIDLGEPRPHAAVSATAQLSFSPLSVAAYEEVAQRLSGVLTVRNDGAGQLVLGPSWWIGDERWQLEGLPAALTVPPSGVVTLPVELEIPAEVRDDFPLSVEIGLSDGVTARAAVPVATGVTPANPHRFVPFPPAMLGGLDVAALTLGAVSDDTELAGLFDGVVDGNGVGLALAHPAEVRLASEGQVPVAGVILQIPPGVAPSERLADFAVELSADGVNFTRVLTARLSPSAGEQAFPLPAVMAARAARLVPISAQGGAQEERPRLAEFLVIASPTFVLRDEGFDIGLPTLGGHVVRGVGFDEQVLTGEGAVWPGDRPTVLAAERLLPPEWIIGFQDGRAAKIAALTWIERPDTEADHGIDVVEVSASIDSPLGPWIPLGSWRVGEEPKLVLPTPVWARALSFRVVEPASGPLVLPAQISIIEAPGPSVLGAWGDLGRSGPYEAERPSGQEVLPVPEVSGDPLAPTALALTSPASGSVRRGILVNWYVVDLPPGTQSVRADFAGALPPDVALTLIGVDGKEHPLEPEVGTPGTLVAAATPGLWRLRVAQPPASVVVAWDTSGSVSGFYPSVARMVRQLAWQLHADSEEINLVPFREESSSFLMKDWSGDRADVYAALHAYPLNDSSSDSEHALLYSASRLADRVGQRAVILVTDASYSGVHENERLWASLARAHAAVFALYLPADADPIRVRAQTSLMSDWAGAAGGHVSRMASQGDSEASFRMVQAWLDRPATYNFRLSADTSPPAPGYLVLQLNDPAETAASEEPGTTPPALALEVILDASGSMLQRLEGRRRIDLAKDVLKELGQSILPDGLQVSLRVFGHDHPGSCENQLLLPLAPLERDVFAAAVEGVQSVNEARTSIAATLRQAGQDLAGISGSASIVLVTDGEETCGGDPLAEIKRLRAAGINTKLNIVGFAIDDARTRQVLGIWAGAGGGQYFDATDRSSLRAAVDQATALRYAVFNSEDRRLAEGRVGGGAVELPPGDYTVQVGSSPDRLSVSIASGETMTISQ